MRTMKWALLLIALAMPWPVFAQSGAPAARGAESYPVKPVRIIVGLAPGGGTDLLARMFAARLQQVWDKPVVVENKPGANSVIAGDFVAKSAPDGHTLLMQANGLITINPFIYQKLPYNPNSDFAPISTIAAVPLVLVVSPSLPVQSVAELVAYAKANPGKLNYGTGGATFLVANEMFNAFAGINITGVSYKGSAPVASALLAGEVQVAVIDTPLVASHINAGRLKALAVSTARRIGMFPALPTIAEAGVPGYEMTIQVSLFAPAGTPVEILSRLNAEAQRFVQSVEIAEKLRALGMEPAGSSAEGLAAALREEASRVGAVVRAAKIKAE